MSGNCISSTLEMPRERETAGIRRDGRQAPENAGVLSKPVKKTSKKQKAAPPVPAYVLVTGKDYDVSGTHTSVKDAEYAGHEIIGQLVLYCFRQGEQIYKFSEYSVRTGGWIRESGTGKKIPAAHAPRKRTGKKY